MEANCDAEVANIKWLIETDFCLGHRETGLNILGWIYQNKGHVDQAVRCYQESMAIRPNNNTALIHMYTQYCTTISCLLKRSVPIFYWIPSEWLNVFFFNKLSYFVLKAFRTPMNVVSLMDRQKYPRVKHGFYKFVFVIYTEQTTLFHLYSF